MGEKPLYQEVIRIDTPKAKGRGVCNYPKDSEDDKPTSFLYLANHLELLIQNNKSARMVGTPRLIKVLSFCNTEALKARKAINEGNGVFYYKEEASSEPRKGVIDETST